MIDLGFKILNIKMRRRIVLQSRLAAGFTKRLYRF